MSEYHIQMNKYNALNAEYDQLYPATKIENVDGLNTALQNKAPAGYGLGTSAVPIDDYNNAVNNGWYRGGNNYPSKINYANYGMIRVDFQGQVVFQTFYAGDTGGAMTSPFMAIRKSIDYGATWSEWEYVNPPMVIGVEYRTTERWHGSPVYAQLFDCSPLPNATTKVFPVKGTYADNVYAVVDYGGMSTHFGQSLQNKGFASLNVTQSKISITTEQDLSAGNAYVWVKYTKSA